MNRQVGLVEDVVPTRGGASNESLVRALEQRIDVNDSEVKVIYTIPMSSDNAPAETVGVLPIIQNGPP